MRRITIIQGHPDSDNVHFCNALSDAYKRGANEAGHEVRLIEIAKLDFPFIKNKVDFEKGVRPTNIIAAQKDIKWAQHILLIYPLWHGTMPALLKAFIEQIFRYDFAFEPKSSGLFKRLLTGRSARIAITMGMPALIYRFHYGSHSLKSLERNVLRFSGIKPIHETMFGSIYTASDARRDKWLKKMESFGRRGV